ncbi:helix-turn-helix domain-containing protein [uncultured Serinicoccus sp.]|uniref:helix-turn-helix domain-containing protein n=1 Tax=uncultured Serinicoccus sp. TaxID=735514 RepID=UPI003457C830
MSASTAWAGHYELAEVTGRSHGAVRNILERGAVPLRGRGAGRFRPLTRPP